MKILLVNAPMLFVEKLTRATCTPHLHQLYSFLRMKGIEVDVVDPVADLGVPEGDCDAYLARLERALSARSYDLAGVSCWNSYQYLGAIETGRLLRSLQPSSPIVVGGTHATAVPQDFLQASSPFDYVVAGPGENALWELCARKERPPSPRLVRAQPVPLDQIVYDWSYPYRMGVVMLSRGCPYQCRYCTGTSSEWDCCSLDRAVDHYMRAAEYSQDGFVHIQDPIFGISKEWRRGFLGRLIELDLPVRPDLEVRADQLDPEDIELLGAVGATVYFGIESGSVEMLQRMNKTAHPEAYLARCKAVLSACERYGVQYMLGVLYNHPGERRDTLKESVEFFWRLAWDNPCANLLQLIVHRFAYFPGSRLDEILPELQHTCGAQIGHPGWWRVPEPDHRVKSETNTASTDLSVEQATTMAQQFGVAGWIAKSRRALQVGSVPPVPGA